MKPAFKYLSAVGDLLAFSPRQLEGEAATAGYLRERLTAAGVPYARQRFRTAIPVADEAILKVNGSPIPCEASSFVSGDIVGKDFLISSLTGSQRFSYDANINFNPKCASISLSNSYFAPSLAVARKDVPAILEGADVRGRVRITRTAHRSENILAGNLTNPRSVVIAHYDSIKLGATDNASGVAVLLGLIESAPETLATTLYVLSGNEELSYDETVYWGHGFRVLERAYLAQLQAAERILVVDCVGNGPVRIYQDERIATLAFPIRNQKPLAPTTHMVSGDIDRLMTVYHSDDDGIEQLDEGLLADTAEAVLRLLRDGMHAPKIVHY